MFAKLFRQNEVITSVVSSLYVFRMSVHQVGDSRRDDLKAKLANRMNHVVFVVIVNPCSLSGISHYFDNSAKSFA